MAGVGCAVLLIASALSGIWWFCLGCPGFAVLAVLAWRTFSPASVEQSQESGDDSVNFQVGGDLHLGP